MSTNNGGPAFPGEPAMRFGQTNEYNQGMSLRDFFAAKAMHGLLASGDKRAYRIIVDDAYEMADAMLKARGEG